MSWCAAFNHFIWSAVECNDYSKRSRFRKPAQSKVMEFLLEYQGHLKPCSWILSLLYESGKVGYYAAHNLHTSSWDTWHPLFPDQTIFYFHTSIVNHFRNKIVSAQRNIHIIQILCTVSQKGAFSEGNFCLCVKNVMYVLDASHIRYRWSYLAKQVLDLKLH